ncbi:MAG TPA: hypothetical protein VG936_14665 [Lacunisphaera sp.]|nr:hypothetical protein [Lacunisphaera sp.]
MDRREPELTAARPGRDPWSLAFAGVLLGAAVLRIELVRRGGQFFWSDESRYLVARRAVERLADHDASGAAHVLLGGADHLFFKILALLPAYLEFVFGENPVIPGLFVACFSVLNIFLVQRIALAAGARAREACLAALLLAGACTGFYYARHLVPYDAALSFGLAALWLGWTKRESAGRSLGCGVAAGLGFLTYNGSWLFGAMVLLGQVAFGWPSPRACVRRALLGLAGLVTPIALALGAAALVGVNLVQSFQQFAGTVVQGDFGRGGALIVEYFWSAEAGNLGFGLAGLLAVIAGAVAARRWTRGLPWVAGTAFLLVGLVALSDWWPKFVVYGRTARQLVPLVCLAGAFALDRLWQAGGRATRLAQVLLVLVLAQAAVNLAVPLRQWFPAQFEDVARREMARREAAGENRQLMTIYADHLLGPDAIFASLPDHDVLLAHRNPLQFVPYQLEGFKEDFRRVLAAADIRMQLIAINEARFSYPTRLQSPHPGVVQLTLRLPTNRAGEHEPLVVTGATGRGDIIYVVYDSPTSIRLGFDHWGITGMVSDPIAVDYEKPVSVIVSMGPLQPEHPVARPGGEAGPDLRHWLYAEVNGLRVWSQPAEFHAAAPGSISFGMNYIGGSTTGTRFTGRILQAQSLLRPDIPPYPINLHQPWPGVVRLTVELPRGATGRHEPLVASGRTGAGDLVYVIYESAGTIRLGFDHWNGQAVVSAPLAVDYGRPVALTLSTGPLHGDAPMVAGGGGPDLRHWLFAAVDGRIAWSQAADFYPASAASINLGANSIGASTAESRFTGKILRVDSVAPGEVRSAERAAR